MAGTIDPFKLVNDEAEKKEKETVAEQLPYQVEAFQIIRIRKSGTGELRREVLDTIMVYKGQVDIAKSKAIYKAKRLGNCMVMMKMEQSVGVYSDAMSDSEDDDFDYRPYRGRR